MSWHDEHGPDELYEKFTVVQNSTGREITGGDEFVFVLRPESDEAAWLALWAYTFVVTTRAPNLARQMRRKLMQIAEVQV